MTHQETEHHQNKEARQTEQVCPVASLYENDSRLTAGSSPALHTASRPSLPE